MFRSNTTPCQDAKETLDTHFELNDTLYARARIEPLESVNLWLGVSVFFCSYSCSHSYAGKCHVVLSH